MKAYFGMLAVLIFIFLACSKEKAKYELFSPEAFAYSLENGWEVNASVQIRGFFQNRDVDGLYSAKLSYYVDMITSEADTISKADYGSIEENSAEKMMDLAVNVQIELDSAFPTGTYKLIFYVTDEFSEKRLTIEKSFEISK